MRDPNFSLTLKPLLLQGTFKQAPYRTCHGLRYRVSIAAFAGQNRHTIARCGRRFRARRANARVCADNYQRKHFTLQEWQT